MNPFDERWQRVIRAARQVPAEPDAQLNVARILAARRQVPVHQAPARREPLRIGWFPPGLAAAAVLAALLSVAAGLDPLPAAGRAGSFLADLPQQVPHAPALAPPVDLPPAASVIAYLQPPSFLPSPFIRSEESAP